MFISRRAALAFFLLITSHAAIASIWSNIRTTFTVGTGYTTIGGTQSIWLNDTPEPGLQNTYTNTGHEHGTVLLGIAFEKPMPITIANLESSIGVEVDSLRNTAITGVVHPMVNVYPAFDTLNYSFTMNSYLLLFTGKLSQFNIYSNLGAYINAGLGYALNQLSDYTEITPSGSSAAPMLAPFGNKSNTRFAYSIGVGVLWQIQQSRLAIGYRYINSGHVGLNTSPVQQTNDTLNFTPCHHLLTLSLTV